MSLLRLNPSTDAENEGCSDCRTMTWLLPLTTCSLVRIRPGSISHPVPCPLSVSSMKTEGQAFARTSLKSLIGCGVGVAGRTILVAVGCGVAVIAGVGVGAGVTVGMTVGKATGVTVGNGVGNATGVTVGTASTMARARWSMSRFSSSSDGPQAIDSRAATANPAASHPEVRILPNGFR